MLLVFVVPTHNGDTKGKIMDLQQALEEQRQHREDLLDMDQLVALLSAKCPGGGVGLFDEDAQKRFAADDDFWPWRDEVLDQTEQDIEDIEKLMNLEAMERFS